MRSVRLLSWRCWLAVTSTTRHPDLPDVPTIAESGAMPGFEVISWQGLCRAA